MRRLEVLMWTDWHTDVRSAAAQALAGTGHGPAVHDSVLDRMSHSSAVIRRDAVRRLGQLGLCVHVVHCRQQALYRFVGGLFSRTNGVSRHQKG